MFNYHRQNIQARYKRYEVCQDYGQTFHQNSVEHPQKCPRCKNDIHRQGEVLCVLGLVDFINLRQK